MAHHKSTIKRAKQNLVRNARNRWWKSRIRSFVKSVNKSIEENDLEGIEEKLLLATRTLAKAKNKGIIKANNMSRRISRLTQSVQKAKSAKA